MIITMLQTLYILVFCQLLYQGESVLLTTEPESYYVHASESVTFKCRVEGSDYVIHDHSPIWYKVQDEEAIVALSRRLVIANGELKENLENRITVAAVDLEDGDKIIGEESTFTLNGIIAEDTGKYECRVPEASGNRTVVQHELHVIERVSSLGIYTSGNTSVNLEDLLQQPPVEDGSEVSFDSSSSAIIQCVAVATSIEPTISIYVDGDQSSGHYIPSSSCVWEGALGLLKKQVCTTMRGDNGFRPPGYMSGKVFECKAHVHHDVEDVTASVTLIVKGRPSVVSERCPNTVLAREGQENVEFRCVVKANPRTDYVGWRVDASGERLSSEHAIDGYTTFDTSVGDHEQEIKLVIARVTMQHFHDYTLFLRNSAGETEQKIQLQQSGESDAITAGLSVKASLLVTALLAVIGVILT